MGKEIDTKTYSLPASTVVSSGVMPALAPFVVSSLGYFYSHMFLDISLELKALLKMVPIFFLAAYCLLFGHTKSKYKYFVAAGLLASSVGDYFLVWRGDDNFLCGMGAFALAHQLYIMAFGFRTSAPLFLVLAGAMGSSVISLFIPHLRGILYYGVPVYIVLISTMFWRAFARLQPEYTWTRGIGAFGALIFAVSDFNLGMNAFYLPSPYQGHHLVTIITYYIGQLCIALSAVDRDTMVRTHLKKLK